LSDCQANLVTKTIVTRIVREVTSSDGLEAAADMRQDFNPSYQTLEFHHVRVIRDGVVRDVDPLASLEIIRRERNLERFVFDGRLTASSLIPDVRVGDIIDVCHSITGDHPTIDRYSAEFVLDWGIWVGETRVSVVAKADRRLTIRSWNDVPEPSTEVIAGGDLRRTWRTTQTPVVVGEPHAPSWVRPCKTIQIADEMTWREVADSFAEAYRPEPLPDDLETAVAAIEAETADISARVVKALRLVQGGLRYQAINIGAGGFAPRSVADIWSTRNGECKDASRILISILARMGTEAAPALVNTRKSYALTDEAPHLQAFDHCITRVALDAEIFWLDPTLPPQGGGRLDVVSQPRFGWALPLPGSDLEPMGEDATAAQVDIVERFELPGLVDDPAELTVKTVFTGWRADGVRRQLENGSEAFSRGRAAWYAQHYETASEIRPAEVVDDMDANRIALVERFKLGRVWRPSPSRTVVFEKHNLLPVGNLPVIAAGPRRWPIWLGRPLRMTQVVEIETPLLAPPRIAAADLSAPGVSFTAKAAALDGPRKVLRIERSLTIEKSMMAASDAPSLVSLWKSAAPSTSVDVRQPAGHGLIRAQVAQRRAQSQSSINGFVRLIVLLLSLLFLVAGLVGALEPR
jgi:transglutaminase-like putative cysteine protease